VGGRVRGRRQAFRVTLLSASRLAKSHGAHVCFDGVDLALEPGRRVGLIGPNGCGKTTQLRVLAGEDEPDGGRVTRRRGLAIACLGQDPAFEPGDTPRRAMARAVNPVRETQAELERRRQGLSDLSGDGLDRAARALARLEDRHEASGGDASLRRADRLLHGVGLPPALLDRPVEKLSGGERRRVALARLLLAEPDCWLLDEPTNHLDVSGIAFLERFLAQDRAAAILVTHDRRLLDRVADEIWELENGVLRVYPGNYSHSRRQREEHRLVQWRAWARQRDEVEKLEGFVAKWRAGTRARQAQSRAKRLARLERIDRPDQTARLAALDLRIHRRLGDKVLEFHGLAAGYGDQRLVDGLDLILVPGETVGVVGPNGAGKTTLFRVAAGELPPLAGTVEAGPTVRMGTLGQHEAFPDENRTPREYLQDAGLGNGDQDRRDKLGAMLFSGDAAERPIRFLSGGERKRLTLTRLLLEGHNVLLLDEPTNHLDIQSSEAVSMALSAYPGTAMVISHDRHLLDEIADRVLWLENGGWRVTAGGYAEAEAAREALASAGAKPRRPRSAECPRPETEGRTAGGATPRPYQGWATAKVERRIIELEGRRKDLNEAFALPGSVRDGGRMRALKDDLEALSAELALLEDEYGRRDR